MTVNVAIITIYKMIKKKNKNIHPTQTEVSHWWLK